MEIRHTTANRASTFIVRLVFITYMLVLSKFILFKQSFYFYRNYFQHKYNWQMVKNGMAHANFIPFKTIHAQLSLPYVAYQNFIIENLGGNIVGFIPPGIMLPLLLKNERKTVLCVFLISLCFELIQLIATLGTFDVDDLLLNTLGGLIGYQLFKTATEFIVSTKKV